MACDSYFSERLPGNGWPLTIYIDWLQVTMDKLKVVHADKQHHFFTVQGKEGGV